MKEPKYLQERVGGRPARRTGPHDSETEKSFGAALAGFPSRIKRMQDANIYRTTGDSRADGTPQPRKESVFISEMYVMLTFQRRAFLSFEDT